MIDGNEILSPPPPETQPETQPKSLNSVARFMEKLSQKWTSLPPEKRVYFIQLGLLAAMQAADILTTYAATQAVPNGTEVNPIGHFLLDKGGIAALGLLKMGVATGSIALLEFIRQKKGQNLISPDVNNMLRFGNGIYAAVIINNTALLF